MDESILMSKNNLFSNEMKRLRNPQAYAADRTFLVSDVRGRDRNLIKQIYIEMDSIALQPDWEEFWAKKGLESPTVSTPNRKFIYDGKEWTYGSLHAKVQVDTLKVNQAVTIALEHTRLKLTRQSKLLTAITSDNLRYLIDQFLGQENF